MRSDRASARDYAQKSSRQETSRPEQPANQAVGQSFSGSASGCSASNIRRGMLPVNQDGLPG